jgi:hypothetical protein
MRLKNHDLIQFLIFNDILTQIFFEKFLDIENENITFRFNNQPLDTLLPPNDKTFINMKTIENDLFFVPIRQKMRI